MFGVETMSLLYIRQNDYEWVLAFKKFHKIDNDCEAIAKLIEIHKAWNREVFGTRKEKL